MSDSNIRGKSFVSIPQGAKGRSAETVLEQIQLLLSYDPLTGLFYRKGWYWRELEGLPVLTKDEDGYLRVSLQRRKYRVHRLVWLLHHGKWPAGQIDHINRDRTDNHIENLRECTKDQNNQNSKPRHDRKFKGVFKRRNKYSAAIWGGNKNVRLGTFDTEIEAARAYNVAALQRFGEFAFLNEVPNEAP